MSLLSRMDNRSKDALRQYCLARMEVLRSYRWTWWAHWGALAEMFLPRRYRWFITPNNWNRGQPINSAIVDETGLLAARTLATGLLSGLTSPTKPWFRLGLTGMDEIPEGPVKEWLAECTLRMLTVYAQSNFYSRLGQAYHDMVVFGTAALIQYEDPEDVVSFQGPPLGQFFLGLDNKNEVDTFYEEYTYTVKQTVDEFGWENCSPDIQNLYRQASGKDREVLIGHSIEPNTNLYEGGERDLGKVVPSRFPYREVYWERSSGSGTQQTGSLLRVQGYKECPFVGLRWDVTANDAYGRSPGMDALPAVRQLQIEQRRKAEAIDKMVRPPMVASVNMKNEPMSILPGGVSYVADPAAAGFKPAFLVEPRVAELMEDLKEVQARVNSTMFVDLFLMISNLGTVRTATEIDARREEKLILLGPVIERTENEGLDEIIERTFSIMSRRGLFPPAPPEIHGAGVSIQYISLLAEAQRAASTSAIERLLGMVGSLVAVKPDAIDNIDTDEAIEHYADLLNVPPNILRAEVQVALLRQQRAQQEQAAQAAATGTALAQGAETLSNTDVGSGQNALQMMLGRAA